MIPAAPPVPWGRGVPGVSLPSSGYRGGEETRRCGSSLRVKPRDVPLTAGSCPSGRAGVKPDRAPSISPTAHREPRQSPPEAPETQKGVVAAGIKGDEPSLHCRWSWFEIDSRKLSFFTGKAEEKRPLSTHIWSIWCWGGCASPHPAPVPQSLSLPQLCAP